jgi:hypothetical protein
MDFYPGVAQSLNFDLNIPSSRAINITYWVTSAYLASQWP